MHALHDNGRQYLHHTVYPSPEKSLKTKPTNQRTNNSVGQKNVTIIQFDLFKTKEKDKRMNLNRAIELEGKK